MDIKSDFLHGDQWEEIYMKNPKGYASDPSLVCKLQKSLYGLKQAPRSWYAKMDSFLLSRNFERCKYDKNVYLNKYEGNYMSIFVFLWSINHRNHSCFNHLYKNCFTWSFWDEWSRPTEAVSRDRNNSRFWWDYGDTIQIWFVRIN